LEHEAASTEQPVRILAKLSQHLSRASVLTLAGFLIGFSLSGIVADEMLRAQILHCGVAGLISVVGLHFVARRRQQAIAQRTAEEEAARAQQVVRSLNSMRESLQEKIRELEVRASRATTQRLVGRR
jgi:predicted Kef-type K+ transport protein